MPNQPSGRARRLNDQRRVDQGLSEMMGLIRGVIADGVVSSEEAEQIAQWSRENPEVASRWPANLLNRRLERIFLDGRVDAKERKYLATLLGQVAENPMGLSEGFRLASDLPLTRPEPEIEFEGATFVFAGEMAFGPTRSCERETEDLGGICEPNVSRRTDYVVIGALGAQDWSQGSFGSVVDEVVSLRRRGAEIAVVSEDAWARALP